MPSTASPTMRVSPSAGSSRSSRRAAAWQRELGEARDAAPDAEPRIGAAPSPPVTAGWGSRDAPGAPAGLSTLARRLLSLEGSVELARRDLRGEIADVRDQIAGLEDAVCGGLDLIRASLDSLSSQSKRRPAGRTLEAEAQTAVTVGPEDDLQVIGPSDTASGSSDGDELPPPDEAPIASETRGRKCVACLRHRTRDAFSHNQWRRPASESRCRDCTAGSGATAGPWTCPWCGEASRARDDVAWQKQHLSDHADTITDAGLGHLADIDEHMIIIAGPDGLVTAGALLENIEKLRADAVALATEEFAEECSIRLAADTCQLTFAVDVSSFNFRGYVCVSPREAVYPDGSTEFEHHVDSLAVPESSREIGIGGALVDFVLDEASCADVAITLWCLKGLRRFYAAYRFYDVDPPADPDLRLKDCVYMRQDSG